MEKLPFDQHYLIALTAPRPFIAADGLNDNACNGNALAQAYRAAEPVYTLLGAADNLGIHYRPGPHALAPEDWRAILDFADLHLKHLPTTRPFHSILPADQLH